MKVYRKVIHPWWMMVLLSISMLPTLCACQSTESTRADIANSPSAQELTEFQWSLMSQGSLVLYQDNARLLPARTTGSGVLESITLKIQIQPYAQQHTLTVPLITILSPYQVHPDEWRLELQHDNRWVEAASFRFSEGRFVAEINGESATLYELNRVRFIQQ